MKTVSHGDVLAAAAKGDDEALGVLVRAYHDRVYQFGLRVCRDGFDADDAVQEAFVKLARRPDVVRDPGALSWLMSVVRNACLRMLRPFVRERRTLGERVDIAEEVASEQLDLILRDLEGLSGDETCHALGLETAAMKTRLHRARMQLRSELLRRGEARGQSKEMN